MMLKSIITYDPYLSVDTQSTHYPYINSNVLSAGNVRYNGNNQSFEVYDGSTWYSMGSFQEIKMSVRAQEILDWAYKKMSEELEFEKLAKDNPAVGIALKNFNNAKEQLITTIHLSKQHEI